MTTQSRKLEIIEQVLHLDSEEALELVEQALRALAVTATEDDIPPMPPRSAEELRARLDQALRESKEGKGIPHEEVREMMLKRYR